MTNIEIGLREQILETANNLLVEKGYPGMSMRDIAEALGVSKAALYYHFQDKEELFLAILEKYLEEMSSSLDQILSETGSSADRVRHFIEFVLIQPAEQRATIRLASQDISQLNPERRKAFGAIYQEKFLEKIGVMLKQGMESGEFREIRLDVAIWALLGIMFPYFYPAHSGGEAVPEQTIQEVQEIFLNGIR